MSSIKQESANLDILMIRGDDFLFSINFDTDLTDYTLNANAGSNKLTIIPITGFNYNILISKQQSNTFIKDQPWTLEWVDPNGKHRTVLSGVIRTR
jgi:hypothetical protein